MMCPRELGPIAISQFSFIENFLQEEIGFCENGYRINGVVNIFILID